jgi:hypothetical protein
MNSGKTYAATEIIQQATRAGLRVAAAKLSGIACLRDTLNMQDHGAIATASFLDCGLPSTVGAADLAQVAKAIIARLNESAPDLIVIELGDGILGGYSVESIFEDQELRDAMSALVFCASDYVGAWGGIELFRRRGMKVDLVAGSVTDSKMGEDYIEREFEVPAANVRRNGKKMFDVVQSKVQRPTSSRAQAKSTDKFCRRKPYRRNPPHELETRNSKLETPHAASSEGQGTAERNCLRILLQHPHATFGL